jgi:hypothetical protein
MKRLLALLTLIPALAQAGDIRFAGFVAAELRGFPEDARFDDQFDGLQPSLVLQPEWNWQSDSRDDQFNFIPFARLDSRDQRRSHADIREAYWLHIGAQWEVLAGINRVFWGVTESRHLVDIINQTDFVEDIDGEDKLGQPMVQLLTPQDWGTVSLFVLPGFRERTFPGKDGRLRFPLVTDGDADYQDSAGDDHVDFAVRYSHYLGAWDFGAYYFKGTGREPRFVPDAGFTRLVPFYDLINQVGTDIQYTRGGWLWKFEGLWRAQHGDHFAATTAGFEYTLYQIRATDADLGLLLEYSYDGRSDDISDAPPTVFNDDIFAGARLTLNDVHDSELLVGFSVDRQDHSVQAAVEAERRLSNYWNMEVESRWFFNTGNGDIVNIFEKDSFVTLRLSRYF